MLRARLPGARDVRIGLCARASAGLLSIDVEDGAFSGAFSGAVSGALPGASKAPRGFLVAGLGAPTNSPGMDSAIVASQQ